MRTAILASMALALSIAVFPVEAVAGVTKRQLAPSPTNSGACSRSGAGWVCDGTSSGTSSSSNTAASSLAPAATASAASPVRTESAANIPASPTNSGACSLHGDHWHCEGTATGVSTSTAIGPKPTGRGECTAHGDHWDCEMTESGEEDVISDSEGLGCVQHGTHFHCPPGVSAGCDALDLGPYDLAVHVAAVFVLLGASAIGVFTPVIFGNSTKPLLLNVFFVLKHFGTGVIISTAFIHLLMHAFVMFANECIGHVAYEAVAPAIAMAAVFLIWLFDFFAARWMSARATKMDTPPGSPHSEEQPEVKRRGIAEMGHDHSCDGPLLRYDGTSRQAHWDVTLLETGIIFHSIMIGVTLGAQAGDGFIPTFCAIIFHQLFEGLGLGARIAGLRWPRGGGWKKWLMCVVYSLITPVGIAIGIGIHESFNLNGRSALLAIGILDSISAGILLYTGLCQLLFAEWVLGELRNASNKRVAIALTALLLGLFAMSLIGKWA